MSRKGGCVAGSDADVSGAENSTLPQRERADLVMVATLVQFIEEDENESFAETSVLVAAIEGYKDQITKLYKQIKEIEVRCEKCQSEQFMQPLEWKTDHILAYRSM
ncbi:hypothetical protein BZA77DRAFT_298255 [Pyronema omphalodes]|nr:hypothetical protein BZA77DRAFT_298255 [Pyronema omphalodes]